MDLTLFTSQTTAIVTIAVILVLTVLLSIIITRKYIQKRGNSLMFWSMGLWFFTIGVLEELLFAMGIYNEFLIASYLFFVALLVESLALGSIQFVKTAIIRKAYYAFCAITSLALLYSLVTSNIGNIITSYIVYGNIPLSVAIISSLITFPAAIILVVVAAISYKARHDKRMLSIISGVIIVSLAGSLYILQFPVFLYISEFVGILLLWYGFL